MNDITYRPFIRDSALGDINIQIPNLEIPVYKPRYSQPLEDDTETEVQSQVEEIRNPEPIVQETTVHKFKSKKDFKDTMLPIYERLLKSKGLNPAFAKSLVAQDGLESAWGSKPAGSYNFGGIKGKGTTKRTREVINGKDVYINDQFRNFKSLEDYANFKIDLLNNKRYKAFSGDIKEFANRVHRGGYATDPRYANILNQVIASAKHGGVLKFQQGGIQEGKQWLEDWYKSRKGLVKQNVKQVLPIPLPVTESLVFNALKRNLDLTRAKINPSKVPDNASGVYYPFGRRIFLTDGSTSTAIHEWTHSSLPDAQEKVIKKYQDNFGDTIYDNKTIAPDEYLDNPQEIYARLMQVRYSINADPNHKFTKKEIQDIKKKLVDHYTLTNRLKGKDGKGSFSTSKFDQNGNLIQTEPFNPEYKIVPEESTATPHYKEENTYNVLNRYSDDFLLHLFNNVAQAPIKKKDTTLYVQKGLKLPESTDPWQVWTNYLKPTSITSEVRSPLLPETSISKKEKYLVKREYDKEQRSNSRDRYYDIVKERTKDAYNSLIRNGFSEDVAEVLKEPLAIVSIKETGWILNDPNNNYWGALDNKKKIKYASKEASWDDWISKLNEKWNTNNLRGPWYKSVDIEDFLNRINDPDLDYKLHSQSEYDKYNKDLEKQGKGPQYMHAPYWANNSKHYNDEVKTILDRYYGYYYME